MMYFVKTMEVPAIVVFGTKTSSCGVVRRSSRLDFETDVLAFEDATFGAPHLLPPTPMSIVYTK